MRHGLFILVLAAATLADAPEPKRAKPAPDLAPGETYAWESKAKRPYWYRLPKAIDPADPPDLIVMCHGTGLDYRWSFWNYPIRTHAWRPHDIVVSPESETPRNGFMQKKADRDDVAALIKTFKKAYPIGNVYLYGHSQGGFFAYYFAGEKPELVDGVIGHAGNFFKCKTNKKARDTVAIGILHGRADAVVTVDCAFMTDLVYRKDDYRMVRLFVVEGLTKQSGHWPLPWHVNELLEWMDVKTATSAAKAVRVAERERAKEKPVFKRLLRACAAAVRLGADATGELKTKVDALGDLLAKARAAHAEAIRAYAQLQESKPAYGPWAAHVRWAQEAFEGDPEWSTPKLVQKHATALAKGYKAFFNRSKRTFPTALKTVETAFLDPSYDDVMLHLGRLHEKPGKLVHDKDAARFAALVKEREAQDKAGRERAVALLAPILAETK